MRIHDPKKRNMVHALSLSVFIAFKGTNVHTFNCLYEFLKKKKKMKKKTFILLIAYMNF